MAGGVTSPPGLPVVNLVDLGQGVDQGVVTTQNQSTEELLARGAIEKLKPVLLSEIVVSDTCYSGILFFL